MYVAFISQNIDYRQILNISADIEYICRYHVNLKITFYICRLSVQADNLHICSADYLYLQIEENALSVVH